MKTRHLLSLTIGLSLCVAMLQAGQGGPGNAGVQFSTNTILGDIQRLVGEEVCFTLTAKDDNGNVIRSWDQVGSPVTLTLVNSTANTDTSMQSWNADPEGYTWAILTHNGTELTKISDNEWSIPETFFVDGMAEVCLTHTKADTGVYIAVTPTLPFLNQISQSVDFIADEVTNFLVDLTSHTTPDDGVYLVRPYEIVVVARDRFLNYSDKMMKTRFTARFPGEFDQQSPGLAEIFSGELFIQGLTDYLIASRIEREKPIEPQVIIAYAADDPTIMGQTDPYEVLSHEPNPFSLLDPADHYILALNGASQTQDFTWERPNPPDPYWDIQVSRFKPDTYSDDIRYEWVIVDSISLTRAFRIASNDNGKNPVLTLTHGQLQGIMHTISGRNDMIHYSLCWYVNATDGLYTTQSDPQPGHYISFDATGITSVQGAVRPSSLALGQNYPNPFNPSTTIEFSTTRRGPVQLKVYDLLGSEVTTILERNLDAGNHTVTYDARELRSGVYVYKLEAEGKVLSRRMIVMK
ncbi:MAG: T9SS type A sorting domain-containing protein [Bacteroidetes bacterium]|nr:T9SS type A sorting domain-containing protein [Bacteroidota bacterium]